jgi:cell division protease FtsH
MKVSRKRIQSWLIAAVMLLPAAYFTYTDFIAPPEAPPAACPLGPAAAKQEGANVEAKPCQVEAADLVRAAESDKDEKRIKSVTFATDGDHFMALSKISPEGAFIEQTIHARIGESFDLNVEFADGHKAVVAADIYQVSRLKVLLGDRYHEMRIVPPTFFQMAKAWMAVNWWLMVIPLGILLAAVYGGGGKALRMGKSKAKLLRKEDCRVTFDDVAGVDEAKADLEEIVEFLRDPRKFQRLGGRVPRGILLVGPPGTGKTLLARAVAGEAGVPFFTISGSDFVEMFVGVGASRVRDMFEQAKKNAPCIIFVDEIDAVGRHRGKGYGQGNDEREQTLNQLLVEMDGFKPNESVILIAATNRPDVLDEALKRPGRFDRQVQVPNPDARGRHKILKVHAQKIVLAADVDLKRVARETPGLSGADLMNLVNEAALIAARRNRSAVTAEDFLDAKDKVQLGNPKGIVMSEADRKLTAYHEGGHALMMLEQEPTHDPLRKVSIVPRGEALGQTLALPDRDRLSQSRAYCLAYLVSLMGGREAERVVFGEEKITSGAASDIKFATTIARSMVTEWGFGSDALGQVRYVVDRQEDMFLMSEATKQQIEKEVRELINSAAKTARDTLTRLRDQLDKLAEELLKDETLTDAEVRMLLGRPVLSEPADDPEHHADEA